MHRFFAVLALAFHLGAFAQEFDVPRYRIANGGGTSSTDDFAITGTVGQHEATVQPLSNADYSVRGGFWSVSSIDLRRNRWPIATPRLLDTSVNSPGKIAISKLLLSAADPDGDSIVLSGVSATSAQGGTVLLADGEITYTPPALFSGTDSFTYTLTDGRGGHVTGTINVTVSAGTAAYNQLTPQVLPGGTLKLSFVGIPGYRYALEWTHDLGTSVWTPLFTNQASATGLLLFTNTPSNPGPDFYRTRHVP